MACFAVSAPLGLAAASPRAAAAARAVAACRASAPRRAGAALRSEFLGRQARFGCSVRWSASAAAPVVMSAVSFPPVKEDGSIDSRLLEAPLEIVKYPDPRLRAKNEEIRVFDANLAKLVERMFEAMYRTDGVGLAAPQVGVNLRLLVFNPEGDPKKGPEVVLCNPVLTSTSKKKDVEPEGCLSFPGINFDVVRHVGVRIEAQDVTGKPFTMNLSGWRARIFQHEFDHVSGTLFIDRVLDADAARVKGELQELIDAFEAQHPGAAAL
eukprot:tig00000507_g1788.t1